MSFFNSSNNNSKKSAERALEEKLQNCQNLNEMFKAINEVYNLDAPLNGMQKALAKQYIQQFVPKIVSFLSIKPR
jgi:hypothetical protein